MNAPLLSLTRRNRESGVSVTGIRFLGHVSVEGGRFGLLRFFGRDAGHDRDSNFSSNRFLDGMLLNPKSSELLVLNKKRFRFIPTVAIGLFIAEHLFLSPNQLLVEAWSSSST